jgi:hypothetical protein
VRWKIRIWLAAVLPAFLLLGVSSASAQTEAFEGRHVNIAGDGRTREGKFELGGALSNRGADGTRLFAISLGRERAYVASLWKPANADPKEFSPPKNEEVIETWLWTEPFVTRSGPL